jgi:hypothetical protein
MIAIVTVSALAFAPTGALRAPSSGRSSGVAMSAKSKALPFLDAPTALDGSLAGDVGFDPLGFSKNGPEAFTWLREAELKHARVCMLAVVGWLAVDMGVHFPGVQYEGLRAITAHDAMVESGNMWGMLMAVGLLELAGGLALYEQSKGNARAGACARAHRLVSPRAPTRRSSPPRRARLAVAARSGRLQVRSAGLRDGRGGDEGDAAHGGEERPPRHDRLQRHRHAGRAHRQGAAVLLRRPRAGAATDDIAIE